MRAFALLAAALSLQACATITPLGNTFEGAQDFAIIPANLMQDGRLVNLAKATTRFQSHPSGTLPATYFNKEADKIQISLKTAKIGWFSEGLEQQWLNRAIGAQLKGEIAMVANVTEGVRQPGSRGEDGKLQGRVVFYSEDVYKGQRLNEFNVPIYGPSAYGGGPLTIDMWVLELDRAESDQMGSVLTTLASMARTNPAVPVPGVDFLSRIGTAFLQSNQDDVIGHFTVTLMPPSVGVPTADPILSVSDLVVRRTKNRHEEMSFANCMYNPKTGDISRVDNEALCGAANDNYLVLALRKSDSATDISPTVNLTDFQERLNKSPGTIAFNQSMAEFVDKTISENSHQTAYANISRLQDAGTPEAVRDLAANDLIKQLQCSLLTVNQASDDVIDTRCGGKGAKARQMPMDHFDRVARRLVAASCVRANDLSHNALVGNMSAEDMDSALTNMKLKVLGRDPCPA